MKLYLDAFLYDLGEIEDHYDRATKTMVPIQNFRRPPAASAAEAAAWEASPNYKLAGKLNRDELETVDPAELAERIRAQAAELARGQLTRATWAEAAVVGQLAQLPDHPVQILPGRVLLKPPVIRRPVVRDGQTVVAEVVYCPQLPSEAAAVVRKLLAHTLPFEEPANG